MKLKALNLTDFKPFMTKVIFSNPKIQELGIDKNSSAKSLNAEGIITQNKK
ncbi:hypothetical protein SAMN03080617_03899 [Algoriphagus alkaliphilus]|uniref:Uncharacterized protein n=1 Tax=Algoriphagus alkaliphilus TaxID=279824 RepID=A0A1G5ZIE2_9BACT|nr:hypothetical protein SAMN03080617_03899 [Algoriphagus alkaliphilus]